MASPATVPQGSPEESQVTLEHSVPADGLAPSFETYLYYAREQRDREAAEVHKGDRPANAWLSELFSSKRHGRDPSGNPVDSVNDKKDKNAFEGSVTVAVTPTEYRAASSSLRIATWGTVFYLITTDIFSPYRTPFAFSQLGYGPGVVYFVVFGVMAAYGGLLLWHLFLRLDSERYPIRSFGELGYRIYGNWFRILCNVLQTVHLIVYVATIMLSNGQGLSQMSRFKLCFSVCNVIWMLAGMILGQIRTLQKFGWVANVSIWLNVLTSIITMVAVVHSAPNYSAAESAYNVTMGPVQTLLVNRQPFVDQVNGVMQVAGAFGGAMIFVEFMAEMRRPMDFWKAVTYAHVLIFVVYMLFGLFVYSYQGQFVINPSNQGISLYSLQTATNSISVTAGLIAAALYGNIGVKVIYQTILIELFHAPPLTVKAGKYLFAVSVIVYWSLAFVIGSAVPQFTNIISLLVAVCIFQFSYTFPPFMMVGYVIQVNALSHDRPYDVNNPRGSRTDTWWNVSRWVRGYKKHFLFNTLNLIIALACLATAAMGAYASVTLIIARFRSSPSGTSFGCRSPLQAA